jgi:hypothetical protein
MEAVEHNWPIAYKFSVKLLRSSSSGLTAIAITRIFCTKTVERGIFGES